MKRESFQQFAIVANDSAHILTEELNALLYELRDKHPTVTFEGMIARVSYEERTEEPEALSEEYEAAGVRLTCGRCPMFLAALKADGTEDNRNKYGTCPCSKYGRVKRDARACEKLYQMINDGEVQLCLAK